MRFLRRFFRNRTPSDRMAAQRACVALVARFEGFRACSYLCPAKRLTVGYGTTNMSPAAVESGFVITDTTTISRDRAMELLESDVGRLFDLAEGRLGKHLPWACAAVASLAYNMGAGRVLRSKAVAAMAAGDWESAEREFKEWRLSGGEVLQGLVRRRNAEWEMLERGRKG